MRMRRSEDQEPSKPLKNKKGEREKARTQERVERGLDAAPSLDIDRHAPQTCGNRRTAPRCHEDEIWGMAEFESHHKRNGAYMQASRKELHVAEARA